MNNVTTVKLMAEYTAFPVWRVGDVGYYEPHELPISDELIQQLKEWNNFYEDQFDEEAPNRTKWTQQKKKDFEREGARLWKLLKIELGKKYKVIFFSERLGKNIEDPSELNVRARA